jgi:hypothetical protein
MRRIAPLIVLILVITRLTFAFHQQKSAPPEEWWANVPSSPLFMAGSPSKRDLSLENRSSGMIVSYTLGCVIQGGGRWRVLHRMNNISTSLEPGKALLSSVSVYTKHRERCARKDARVAVVEVHFSDGSVWKSR